ncbi:sedoheptulokinase [Paenibacillus sp. BK033]|uniref:sedoheptulokinase n=1 Tax=Paenibacillus sp. BK033 TaxID=2512133 RepID=UPI0010E21F6E|nr:FGGY family carbohydrate kinase [Paenibacillus sp. BK033]TCN01874.1 sedoheptulokinase [Paenibacillus sp. BK033]
MHVAGIDIGTSSICCVVVDTQSGEQVAAVGKLNDSGLASANEWERAQDPERIAAIVQELIGELGGHWDVVAAVGISCQMHGVLYVDGNGDAASPLYTWQDRRGDCQFDDAATYSGYMRSRTGYPLASGYGLVTHFYNARCGLVPQAAVYLCTIGDYIAMRLCGSSIPMMDASNAASLGLFDLEARQFDIDRIRELGLDPGILPPVAVADDPAGRTADGKLVACAIGDNQASFLGSVPSLAEAMLVNIGTGAQVSVFSESPDARPGIEVRPFPGSGYLLAGASLGGGKSYALLASLFRDVLSAFGEAPAATSSMYERMNEMAEEALREGGTRLRVSASFFGTRENPAAAGSISGIDESSLTAKQLVLGVLSGVADELLGFAASFPGRLRSRISAIAASGNGIRKNRVMQQLLREKLGYPLRLSRAEEEAAFGAALYAGVQAGLFPSCEAAISHCQRSEAYDG